jgi:hypothetical protein
MAVFNKIQPISLYYHCIRTPKDEYWNQLKGYYGDKLIAAKIQQPISIFSHTPSAKDFAHKSDIVRLNVLKAMGGIYIDTDILVFRSFDGLRNGVSLAMGLQTETGDFCNGVIVARNDSKFLRAWYEGYKTADFAKCWDCHSVKYPSKLAVNMSGEVTILPVESFYDPSFGRNDIRELYSENIGKKPRLQRPYKGKFGQHLWHTAPSAPYYLRQHRFQDVCNSTSMYNDMLRYALEGSDWLKKTCPNV